MRDLVSAALAATVVARPGWCGAGVHVFPAASEVATRGGVVHFDTEGLADFHLARHAPAVSLVLMLQPPERGGGLRLWPLRYEGREAPAVDEIERAGDASVFRYAAGDALLFDSYRLHQIEPFNGERDRVSATLHAAELAPALWESWF
jgi:hypothetical protein